MPNSDQNTTRKASEKFRRKRMQAGQSQVQIWLDQKLRDVVDKQVAAGKFKNRSEAITAAIHTAMIEGEMT